MSRKDAILTLRQILMKRRDALRKALAGDLSLLRELNAQASGDMVDAALDSVQDEISSQLAEVESRELARIEYALDRIAKGSLGFARVAGRGFPWPVCMPCPMPHTALNASGKWNARVRRLLRMSIGADCWTCRATMRNCRSATSNSTSLDRVFRAERARSSLGREASRIGSGSLCF